MLIKNIYLLVICLTWVQLAQAQSTSFQWGKQIGGDSSTAHKFIDFKTDLFGNTYSLGYFSGTVDLDPGPATYHLSASGNFGFYILKLNASGNFAWAKSISNSDIAIANSLCVDGFGNVYTTGYFTTVTDFDPSNGKYVLTPTKDKNDGFILKLSSSGAFVWAKQLTGTSYIRGESIACDNIGNLYATGYFYGQTDFDPGPSNYNRISIGKYDAYILKLNSDGHFIWVKTMGSKKDDGNNYICLDQVGNLYVSGSFSDSMDFDPDINNYILAPKGRNAYYVSKHDTAGNFKWTRSFGDTLLDFYPSITADQNENILLTGGYKGIVDFNPGTSSSNRSGLGSNNFYLLKLDAFGEMVWVKTLGGINIDYSMRGNASIIDDTGNVYCIGNFNKDINFNPDGKADYKSTSTILKDLFIIKYNMYGQYQWSQQINGNGDEDGLGFGMDNRHNFYLSGEFDYKIDCDPDTGAYNLSVIKKGVSDIFIIKLGDKSAITHRIDFNKNCTIYPNPTNGNFSLQLKDINKQVNIEIYNTLGTIVYQSKSTDAINAIDLSHLPNDLYIVKISTANNQIFTQKIIKY